MREFMKKLVGKNKRAFTLIELIVVIAVIGILVLLAAPKFLGYTKDAKLAQITNDIKAYESAIEIGRVNDDMFIDEWELVDKGDLESYRDLGSLFDKKGAVGNDYQLDDEYLEIEADLVDSKLTEGTFFLAEGGKVYYGSPGEMQGESIYIAGDEDFEWVETNAADGYIGLNGESGYFKYIGVGHDVVEIPHVIKGVEMTSYRSMFSRTGADVTEVISTNKDITDTQYMFYESETTSLDLSSLDTSNTTNMSYMFQGVEMTELNLNSLDTSNVKNMSNMFKDTQVNVLDLNNFNTENVISMNRMFDNSQADFINLNSFSTGNVESMASMFAYSKVKTLDLSTFDTSKAWGMGFIFSNAAAEEVYVRNDEELNKFSRQFGNPVNLEFSVKK